MTFGNNGQATPPDDSALESAPSCVVGTDWGIRAANTGQAWWQCFTRLALLALLASPMFQDVQGAALAGLMRASHFSIGVRRLDVCDRQMIAPLSLRDKRQSLVEGISLQRGQGKYHPF